MSRKPKLDLIDCAAERMPWQDWHFRLAMKVSYRDHLKKEWEKRHGKPWVEGPRKSEGKSNG